MIIKKYFFLIISLFIATAASAQLGYNDDSDSTLHLDDVIVNAFQIGSRLHQVTGSISVLSGSEIAVNDGNNLSHIFNGIPGLFMHSGTYSTSRIIIRGVGSRTPYNTNRIKTYLNDVPITSSDGISTLEDIDMIGIERVEVIKGPTSALYGSGLGGNINLYTPSVNRNSGDALIQYGSYNTMKVAAGGRYTEGNFKMFANLSHMQTDGYRENSAHKRTTFLSTGAWQHETFSVEYSLLLTDLYSQLPSSVGKSLFETNPRAAAANWKNVEGYKEYQRAIGGVSLINRLNSNWNNRLTIFGRWVDSYERRPFNNLDDGTGGGGIRNRLSYHTSHWDALIGFEWISDSYRWQMDLDNELINKNRETRNSSNIFGMVYLRPSHEWNISIGGAVNSVKYELTDLFADNGDQSGKRDFPAIFSPRFGVNYAPSKSWALFGSIGHGFSMPSPEETLLPEGDINSDLKPEQGIQYEMGTRINLFGNSTQFELTAYMIDLDNLLVTKRVTEDIFTGINAGITKHWGIEFNIKQQIFNLPSFPGSMSVNANYTWSRNKFVDFIDDEQVYDGKKLPGIPDHVGQALLKWQPLNRLNLDAQFQYVGSQFIDDANTKINDSYFITNLKAYYRLPKVSWTGSRMKRSQLSTSQMTNSQLSGSRFSGFGLGNIEIFAGINNLFDFLYSPMLTVNAVAFGNAEPRYYYAGLPRHFYGGVRLNLD